MSDPSPQLRVLSATAYESFGGAERIAVGLHLAYLKRGVDSWIAFGRASGTVPHSVQIPNDEMRGAWARALLNAADAATGRSTRRGDASWQLSRSLMVLAEPFRYAGVLQGREDFDYPGSARLLDLAPRRPDILHLHSLHGGYFDIRALPALSLQVPTVLTLHDMWLLTGHCAHPLDCDHWSEACGDCPYPGLYVPIRHDASAANRRVKRQAVARSRVHIATPSRWLMDRVEAAALGESVLSTRVIPNGIDTSLFSPGSKEEARAALRLPPDRPIVLFAAREVEANPFKDYATLLEALRLTSAGPGRDVLLVALGATRGTPEGAGFEVRAVPFVDHASAVARYYRAADVYVHAAKAENFPLAVIEAMACATAVVASDVGGIPEAVTDGATGLLVPPRDAEAMARAIERLLDDEALRAELAGAGRARALAEFSFERQVDAYLDWYAEIVG